MLGSCWMIVGSPNISIDCVVVGSIVRRMVQSIAVLMVHEISDKRKVKGRKAEQKEKLEQSYGFCKKISKMIKTRQD